jgi:hypothetical protein
MLSSGRMSTTKIYLVLSQVWTSLTAWYVLRLASCKKADSIHRIQIEYYFAHCCWIFNHLNEVAFRKAWGAYKSGLSTDQLTLATCCLILATTV